MAQGVAPTAVLPVARALQVCVNNISRLVHAKDTSDGELSVDLIANVDGKGRA